ncbi:hypothetical protein FKP32DRAFT_1670876, partial [Trametes sanguinea]
PSSAAQPEADPPSYVPRPPDFTEHRYQLEDSKGRPWLWLTVKSRSREARQLPLFFDRDTITGTVEADLDKADGSKGVLISVGPPSAVVECSSVSMVLPVAVFVMKPVLCERHENTKLTWIGRPSTWIHM